MKETRNIRCVACGRRDSLVMNAQSGKWEYPEPGWALINYANICPVCNEKLVAQNKETNRKNHEKWLGEKNGKDDS